MSLLVGAKNPEASFVLNSCCVNPLSLKNLKTIITLHSGTPPMTYLSKDNLINQGEE